jgi:hypothetical protein
MMTILQFAEKYRLKRLPAGRPSKRCNSLPIEVAEDVIEGKCGFIGEGWGDGRMIAHILAVPRNANVNKKLASRTRILEAAELTLKAKSGYESEWYFDPANESHRAAVIEAVEPRRLKTLSEASLSTLRERMTLIKRPCGEKIPFGVAQSAIRVLETSEMASLSDAQLNQMEAA